MKANGTWAPPETWATACSCHPHERKNRADCFTLQQLFLITVRWAISEQTQTWQETRLSPGLFISQPFVMPRRGPSNYFVPGFFIWGFQSINNPATLTPQDNRFRRVDPKPCPHLLPRWHLYVNPNQLVRTWEKTFFKTSIWVERNLGEDFVAIGAGCGDSSLAVLKCFLPLLAGGAVNFW